MLISKENKIKNGYVYIIKLIYYEVGKDIEECILKEKQIKAGSRLKKVELKESINLDWKDLYDGLV